MLGQNRVFINSPATGLRLIRDASGPVLIVAVDAGMNPVVRDCGGVRRLKTMVMKSMADAQAHCEPPPGRQQTWAILQQGILRGVDIDSWAVAEKYKAVERAAIEITEHGGERPARAASAEEQQYIACRQAERLGAEVSKAIVAAEKPAGKREPGEAVPEMSVAQLKAIKVMLSGEGGAKNGKQKRKKRVSKTRKTAAGTGAAKRPGRRKKNQGSGAEKSADHSGDDD